MSDINWNLAPDIPTHYSLHQKLFYKITFDKKCLYVFDDGVWKISSHPPEDFKKYYKPVANPHFQEEMATFIYPGKHHSLKVWAKMESGRVKRLAAFLGVTAPMVSGMCNGRKLIPIEHLLAISYYTNIHPKYLRRDLAQIFNIHFDDQVLVKATELERMKAWMPT